MTTKDKALKMALDALEYSKSYLDELADVHGTSKKAKPGSPSWNVNRAITACREALAQKDDQALHAGAAVPSEAISLSGDAKLAHDQCRAVAHLANSFAEVYAARAAIVAHDAKLSDLIGDASASAMEWLGDELNAMDAATEDDGWLDPIFEAAQKRWPQQPPRRPQKDEQEPVAEITADDMGRPFNAIRIGAHFYKEIPPVGTKLYTAPPERQPHNLNCTVFVYRHRETGAIRALYTEDARAMTGRDDYEHVASLEPRMWIEHHFDDAAEERQPLTDEQIKAAVRHLYGSDAVAAMAVTGDIETARAVEEAIWKKNS